MRHIFFCLHVCQLDDENKSEVNLSKSFSSLIILLFSYLNNQYLNEYSSVRNSTIIHNEYQSNK